MKATNAKSVTYASIQVMFIFKYSDTVKRENSLLDSPIVIPCYGFNFRSTDLALTNRIHRIPGQFVNKHGKDSSVI